MNKRAEWPKKKKIMKTNKCILLKWIHISRFDLDLIWLDFLMGIVIITTFTAVSRVVREQFLAKDSFSFFLYCTHPKKRSLKQILKRIFRFNSPLRIEIPLKYANNGKCKYNNTIESIKITFQWPEWYKIAVSKLFKECQMFIA